MTPIELKTILIENSPFKIKGTNKEIINFKNDSILINDELFENIIFSKTDYGFTINYNNSLIPFYTNLKIQLPDNTNFPIIINYDAQKLKNDKFRNEIAEEGFLILVKVK